MCQCNACNQKIVATHNKMKFFSFVYTGIFQLRNCNNESVRGLRLHFHEQVDNDDDRNSCQTEIYAPENLEAENPKPENT